jgi:hypothetical protein
MGVTAATRLVLIPPMMPLGRTIVRHGRGSWKKWTTILRWSLGWEMAEDSGGTSER